MSLHCSGFGKVGCCAFAGQPFPFNGLGPFSIEEMWNGSFFQTLRSAIGSGELEGSGCETCPLATGDHRAEVPPFHALNARQQSNYDLLMAAHRNKDEVVEAFPARYQFNFSSSCNIKCIMCNQHDARDSHFRDECLSAEALLKNREVLSYATSINVSGGEPLCSSECRIFLDALCTDEALMDVELDMVSNGLLLPRIYDLLRRKDRLRLTISLDGTGPVHEYIRKGSSWEKVKGVINEMVSTRDRMGKTGWRFGAEFILMKSNLSNLSDYIRFCLDREITPGILHLMPTRDTEPEDLVRNPRLLKELGGWDGMLSQARDLLNDSREPDIAAVIEDYRLALHAALADKAQKKGFYSRQIPSHVLSNPEQIYGRRVLIWGVGGNYRYCLADWLKANIDKIQFLGFTSNWEQHWGTQCDGYPVINPRELKSLLPDVIIVAAQQMWRTEIIEQIREMTFFDPIII